MGLLRPDGHLDNTFSQPIVLLDNAALDADWRSDVIQLSRLRSMSVHIERGITIEGTLSLVQANINDEAKMRPSPDVVFTAIDGVAGGECLDFYNLEAEYYQFRFVRSAGPGALWIAIKVKG